MMPRRITAAEAAKMDLEPVEDGPRKVTADEAARMDLEPVEEAKDERPTMGDVASRFVSEKLPQKIRAALEGVTSNLAPHALAGMEGVKGALTPGESTFSSEYERTLPEYQKQYTEAAKAQPGSNILGAMAQPSPFGKMKGVAGVAARVGQAGALGALSKRFGGEPGAMDSSPLDDAMGPALIQGGAEAASPPLGKLARKLHNTAGSAAANAAGLRGGIVNQAKRAGIATLDAADQEAIPALGNKMLDEGLIPWAGSKVAVQRRAEDLMDRTGTAAQALRDKGDAVGKFDQALGVKAAAERLGERIDPAMGGNLQTGRAAGRAQEFITDAANTPDTFAAADKLKRGAYGNTNWSTEAPDAAKLKRATVSGYRQSIEDQLEKLVPGAGEDLKKVNEGYGLGAQTADFAEEAAGREAANSKFGWGSLMLGASGMGAGNAIGPGTGLAAGVGLPVLAHLAKTRGAAAVASPLRGGSKLASGLGEVVNQSPAAASALDQYLESDDFAALRKRFGGD